ncbi:hypothetical protein, partial [Staphylococcus epidermidis]|uniref:hypothetical protein n=1 Tax=Staphylococcus epidermidis TaxID=1282 RepID=UPI001C93712C
TNALLTPRPVTSHPIPTPTIFIYHPQHKHIHTPPSQITHTPPRSHNPPTPIHLKPTQLLPAYPQITYHFNYYPP